MTYRVIRFSMNHSARTLKRGLTLEQAQAICKDHNSSSTTCTSKTAKARSARLGCPWFIGYDKD